ncbi:MAG: chromosome segregation protein SMC [Clostridia bacterium]|nr:chromosome segregation protein SMC [Clostridia bacterium]
MRLKKLVLYGFKSFATRTEIVFGSGITGIVGPNGSGKSNIADAVRWVLGEQSAKTLRGASMSDVIFNGTQKRKPLNYCEVSLVFDNEDKKLSSDFSEIAVTRRVYRSGDSEYFMNQSSCRLKDVIDLFRDTGIGKEGYSIIGQGRIDEILSRKSEDRRLIFEEAAGIVKYKARKEEADRKLDHTLENASRIDDILEELAKQLKPLAKQSEDARKYLAWYNELKTLEINLFLVKTDRNQKKISELAQQLAEIQAMLDTHTQHLQDKNIRRDEIQQEIEALDEQLLQDRAELDEVNQTLHQSEVSLRALRVRMESRKENQLSIENEKKRTLMQLEEMCSEEKSVRSELSEQDQRIEDAQQVLSQLDAQLQVLLDAYDAASLALTEHKNSIIRAMNRASSVQNDQTRLITMRDQMNHRLEEMQSSLTQLTDKQDELEHSLEEASEQTNVEEKKLLDLQEAYTGLAHRLEQLSEQVQEKRRVYDILSRDYQSALSRHKVLEELTREMEGYAHSVRDAISYAKDHQVKGVHGVLAQLISVPEKLETALDMALGGALQNIVTTDEETAKILIDYLRNQKKGRATFLPISSIRSRTLNQEERKVLHLPGCLGIASELISYDRTYQGIMENLLGRTLIADNLEHGIAIMRQGRHAFRLVTLAGDVMHSGGSMTGGSVQSKAVNLLGRQREIKDLEQTISSKKEEMDRIQSELATLHDSREQMRTQLSDSGENIHQQEILLARENDRCEHARISLEDHLSQIDMTREAIIQLQDSIDSVEQQLAETEKAGKTEETTQEEMEVKTHELEKDLSEKQATLDQTKEQKLQQTLMLSDLKSQSKLIHNNLSHILDEIHRMEKENEERLEHLRQIDAQMTEDQNAEKELEQIQAAQTEKQHQQEDIVKGKEDQRSKIQGSLRSLLSEIDQLHDQESNCQQQFHRLEISKNRAESEQKSLEEKIWSSYELTYGTAEPFRQSESFSEPAYEKRCKELNSQIKSLGNVNVSAVDAYEETKARYDDLMAQQNDLKKAEEDLRQLIDQLIQEMKTTFVQNFSILQGYFTETFERLFGGGHAELSLTDPEDPLNCGIEVNAQPPGKKLQLLSLLSGGERALTAIAILFAMLKLKPTPFCILDEIEAALDDANIGYYADYLKEYSKDTQFVVITHRKGTMERCNSLFGVAMEEQGVSKMVSVSLQDYSENM